MRLYVPDVEWLVFLNGGLIFPSMSGIAYRDYISIHVWAEP